MLIPMSAAALPAGLEYDDDGKLVTGDTTIRAADSLSDGEVYTYTTVTGNPLPSTDFTVGLSAIGQKYRVTTTTTVPTVTVLVVDVSGSMDWDIENHNGDLYDEKSRMDSLKEAAATFVDTVVPGTGGTNYVAVVTYSTYAYKTLEFTNSNSTLKSTINGLNADGGTNTHGGLIAAYKMINNPTSYGLTAAQVQNAAYSVVFMSDGEPTYYYYLSGSPSLSINSSTVYGNLGFNSSARLSTGTYTSYSLNVAGPGSSSNSDTLNNAQSAANIIKTTGVKPTVYSVYIKNESYTSARSTMEAIATSVDTTYTPENSTSLTAAFAKIATSIRDTAYTPIEEVDLSSPVSFVTMSYQMGAGYILPDSTMTVSLGGNSYTMTQHGTSYTYDVSSSDANYNAKLAKLVLTVEDGIITWQIPASVLPCNSPEPVGTETQTFATPITLYFTIRFNESAAGLAAGTYPTSSSITASFYPTTANPFYYTAGTTGTAQSLAVNSTSTHNVTTYYTAAYPYPGSSSYSNSNTPTLTGFGTGESASSITYISNPSNIQVTAYNDKNNASNDTMSLTYNNSSVSFGTGSISFKTATASFSTTNKADANAYTVTKFTDDGTHYFSDAEVSAVSGNNITITYGKTGDGPRSVTFTGVSFTTTTAYETSTITAKFKGYYGSDYWLDSMSLVELNGVSVSPEQTVSSSNYDLDNYSNGYDYFDIDLQVGGKWYSFNDVQLYYRNTTSTSDLVTGTNQTATGTAYVATDKTQSYYVATTSTSSTVTENIENYRFLYDNAVTPSYLTVQVKSGGAWTNEGSYTAGTSTSIVPNSQGGYTVRTISGSTVTTTAYTVSDNTLYKQVSTSGGRNGVSLTTGIVTHTLSVNGAMVLHESLSAEECIPSATLKSPTGTNLATANSSGVADLVLRLTVSGEAVGISNVAVTLGYSASTAPDTFTYTLTAAKNSAGTSILEGGNLPATLATGTYYLTYRTTASYSDPQSKPEFYTVGLQSVSFTLPSGTARELIAATDTTPDADQQVKVVLITAAGH